MVVDFKGGESPPFFFNIMWYTGSGKTLTFEAIIEKIKLHSQKGGTVFVGTDSCVSRKKCVFSTAICLHGAEGQKGGRYFISRRKVKAKEYPTLLQRITSEVEKSIDIGMQIMYHCPRVKIELHLDVSDSTKGEGTSKFSDMLIGYAKGSGFECKVKPDAFAASTIADKHSK